MKEFWQRAAWLVSGIVFFVHVLYERSRLRSSPRFTALHASLAAALGAFGLAAVASIRVLIGSSPGHSILALALVLWPVVTAIPAFVAALVIAVVLNRVKRKSQVQ